MINFPPLCRNVRSRITLKLRRATLQLARRAPHAPSRRCRTAATRAAWSEGKPCRFTRRSGHRQTLATLHFRRLARRSLLRADFTSARQASGVEGISAWLSATPVRMMFPAQPGPHCGSPLMLAEAERLRAAIRLPDISRRPKMITKPTRRDFLQTTAIATSAALAAPYVKTAHSAGRLSHRWHGITGCPGE